MPAISVIVPVYQAEALLPQCVESVLAQTFSDWELLVIDGLFGSGKLMKGGRSKKSVNNSWHKNDRPVTIPPFVRPKEILWRERR